MCKDDCWTAASCTDTKPRFKVNSRDQTSSTLARNTRNDVCIIRVVRQMSGEMKEYVEKVQIDKVSGEQTGHSLQDVCSLREQENEVVHERS